MTVYVAEISGRGIVAFEAADADEAKARLADRALQRDLHVLQNEGRPLWDGVSEIRLRKALPKEAEAWQAGGATAGQPEGSEPVPGQRLFLVPVVDPSSFDDEDDDDDDHDNSD